MDKHLADSVLERYRSEQAARQRALPSSTARSQSLDRPTPSSEVAQIAGATIAGVVGVALFIVILLTHPEFWWLIFLIPGLFFPWSRRWRHDGYSRRSRRIDGGQGPQASSSGQSSLSAPTTQSGRDVEML
jgi:hypothetical protein